MLDDDIQYLGTRLKPREPPRFPQRPVTGVSLHIEKSDGNDAYVLTFARDKSSTVNVGRRPGSEIESRLQDQEKGRAMFRCAVVSRKHAKIAFSDSGHAYLIDLNSHHGTHVRKPGETSSRILEPEMPIPLSDGDVITFGKSVGRSEEMVRPVVARVQLLYNGPSVSAIKPLVVPDSTSIGSKPASGRYGLHSPSSSSSSDDYNGQSDSYSDIEEIPPPVLAPVAPVAPVSQPDTQSKSESHLGRAFEVLKRLLPPTSITSTPPHHEPSSPIFDEGSSAQSNSTSSSSPPSELPPLWSLPGNRCSPFSLFPRYSSLSSIDFPDNFFSLPPINSSQNNDANPDDDGNRSLSESPMDLASPSPPPGEQPEPPVIGAWSNFSSSASESEPIATPPDNLPTTSQQAAQEPENRAGNEAEERAADNSNSSFVPVKDKEKEKDTVIDLDVYVTKMEYEDLQAKHIKLQEEVNSLQMQRRKYKAKFNANVHTVTDKFAELEDRVNDVNAQCTLFMDQIEDVTNADVPDLQAQIDDLHDQQALDRMEVDEFKRRIGEWEDKAGGRGDEREGEGSNRAGEKEQVEEHLRILRGLIDEMKITEQQAKTELESLRQLRQSILNEPSTPSLKRKRTAEDEGERDAEPDNNHEEAVHLGDHDIIMSAGTQALQAGPYECEIAIRASDRPSPRKRVRRLASVAAHTATAITVGAVVAWSALAFY